jgi:hypothetical protein
MKLKSILSSLFCWLSTTGGKLKLNQQKTINVNKANKFTHGQIANLADIARDVAQIVFAALVIDGLGQEVIRLHKVIIGGLVAAIFWFTSHKLSAILKI